MKVISLFDGLACGLQALKQADIEVSEYHAFEIDKYAIQIAKKNHPEIIHHGSVVDFDFSIFQGADLLIGGSPCQSFSFAGKMDGMSTIDNIEIISLNQYLELKENGFKFKGESYLFWEYVKALREIKPKNFMLENVKMLRKWSDVISQELGTKPILINSALLAAQNRQRNYWCNWRIEQPKDKGITLSDILESELPSCGIGARIVGRRLNELGKRDDYNHDIPIAQYLELRTDNKSNCLTTVYKDSVVPYYKVDKRLKIKLNQSKASCLTAGAHSGGNHSDMDILVIEPNVVRRFSIKEEERLQTLKDDYTSGVSGTQRHKMIANGWTVSVIEHLFRELKCQN